MRILKIEIELKGNEESELRDALREAQADGRCLVEVLQEHAARIYGRCGIELPPKGAQMGLFFRPARLVSVTKHAAPVSA